jgi:hypothetical protein
MVADETYFLQRAKAEADAASRSSNAEARTAHLELSARYEELASSIIAHSAALGLSASDPSFR